MHDLSVTIVEEHTKRLSRNLALTQTRRRTITFEEPPGQQNSQNSLMVKSSKPKTICSTLTTEKALRPIKNPQNSTVTTTTVAVPYKNFQIWTDYDKDQNLLLHIKERKEAADQKVYRNI